MHGWPVDHENVCMTLWVSAEHSCAHLAPAGSPQRAAAVGDANDAILSQKVYGELVVVTCVECE